MARLPIMIDQSDYENSVFNAVPDERGALYYQINNAQNTDDVLEMTQTTLQDPERNSHNIIIGENAHVKMIDSTLVEGDSEQIYMSAHSTLELAPKFLQAMKSLSPNYGLQIYNNNFNTWNNTKPYKIVFDTTGLSADEMPRILLDDPPAYSDVQVIGATHAEYIDLPGESPQLVFSNDAGEKVVSFNLGEWDPGRIEIDPTTGIVHYACYLKGTHIATPDGESKVEDLKAGDMVLTASGGIAKVKWLGYRTLQKSRIPEKDAKRAFPILFKKGCITDNVPHRDLIMSPGHHVFFDGNLVPALALVNGKSIVQQFQMQSFQYFHVELEQFDILLAEGVPAESYVDTGNRSMFQNAHEVAMNPDFGPATGRPVVPGITVVRKGPVVEAIRAKLLERADWRQVPDDKRRSA